MKNENSHNYIGRILIDHNPSSPNFGNVLALHWVIGVGADCDGNDWCFSNIISRISITPHSCADLAKWDCDSSNFWSDGRSYFVISDIRNFVDFCYDNEIEPKEYVYAFRYKTANDVLTSFKQSYNDDGFNVEEYYKKEFDVDLNNFKLQDNEE